MSIRAVGNAFRDTFGQIGVVTSLTLNLKSDEEINKWLAVVISILTCVYLTIRIIKELKK